jgi:hypothetical protein
LATFEQEKKHGPTYPATPQWNLALLTKTGRNLPNNPAMNFWGHVLPDNTLFSKPHVIFVDLG